MAAISHRIRVLKHTNDLFEQFSILEDGDHFGSALDVARTCGNGPEMTFNQKVYFSQALHRVGCKVFMQNKPDLALEFAKLCFGILRDLEGHDEKLKESNLKLLIDLYFSKGDYLGALVCLDMFDKEGFELRLSRMKCAKMLGWKVEDQKLMEFDNFDEFRQCLKFHYQNNREKLDIFTSLFDKASNTFPDKKALICKMALTLFGPISHDIALTYFARFVEESKCFCEMDLEIAEYCDYLISNVIKDDPRSTSKFSSAGLFFCQVAESRVTSLTQASQFTELKSRFLVQVIKSSIADKGPETGFNIARNHLSKSSKPYSRDFYKYILKEAIEHSMLDIIELTLLRVEDAFDPEFISMATSFIRKTASYPMKGLYNILKKILVGLKDKTRKRLLAKSMINMLLHDPSNIWQTEEILWLMDMRGEEKDPWISKISWNLAILSDDIDMKMKFYKISANALEDNDPAKSCCLSLHLASVANLSLNPNYQIDLEVVDESIKDYKPQGISSAIAFFVYRSIIYSMKYSDEKLNDFINEVIRDEIDPAFAIAVSSSLTKVQKRIETNLWIALLKKSLDSGALPELLPPWLEILETILSSSENLSSPEVQLEVKGLLHWTTGLFGKALSHQDNSLILNGISVAWNNILDYELRHPSSKSPTFGQIKDLCKKMMKIIPDYLK